MQRHKARSGPAKAIAASVLALGLAAAAAVGQTSVAASSNTAGNWTTSSIWTCTPAVSPCLPNNSASDTFNVAIGNSVTLDNTSTLTTVTVSGLDLTEDGGLQVNGGETLNIAGNLTDSSTFCGGLGCIDLGFGLGAVGGALNVGGDLTNAGNIQIGNHGISGTVTVDGTFDDTGGDFFIQGGNPAGNQSTMNVTGAAPGTFLGSVDLMGGTAPEEGIAGGAVLNYGSGQITAIGTSTSFGKVILDGADAFIESGGASGNRAFSALTTIAENGSLYLFEGEMLSTTPEGGTFTNSGFLAVTADGVSSANVLAVNGGLANAGQMEVGEGFAGTVSVTGSGGFTNTGSVYIQGGSSGAGAQLNVTNTVTNSGTINIIGSTGSLKAASLVNDGTYIDTTGVTNLGAVSGTPPPGSINIGSDGRLTDNGTVNVGASNTPGTVNNAGTLTVGSTGVLNLLAGGAYTQSAGTTEVNGSLISLTVTVSDGTLEGAGTIQGAVTQTGGTLQPGDTNSPGTLAIIGDVNLSNANFNEQIGGSTPGTEFSVLDVSGSLDFVSGDTLSPLDLGSFTPTNGEIFDIINAGSMISGTFDDNSIPFAGGTFSVNYLASGCVAGYTACVDLTFQKSVTPVAEPGTLLLFAVGFAGMGWLVRRRIVVQA